MFPIIVLFVPVAVGISIFMRGELTPSRIISGFLAASAVFVAIILGVASIHPPGDYRHHKAERTSSHQGGGL